MVREKNLPFRTAHQIVGRIVSEAVEDNVSLDKIDNDYVNRVSVEITGEKLDLGDDLVRQALDPSLNVKSRTVKGGCAPSAVNESIEIMESFLNN